MDNILHSFDCDKLQPALSTSEQDTSELFVMVRHLTDDSNDSNGTTMPPQLNRFDKDTFATETEEMPILEISDESEDDDLFNFSNDIKLEVEEHELQTNDFELETEQGLEFEEREVRERELHPNEHNLEAEQQLEIEEHDLGVQEHDNEGQDGDPCSIFDEYSSCSSDIWADFNTVLNESKLDDNNALKSKNGKRIRQRAVCHICGLILSRVDQLRIHIQGVHDTNKVYKCTHCDHTTNSKLYLQRHFKLNHSFVTELFSCTYCSFKTHKILYLNNHVKRDHTNHGMKYVCEFCSFETEEKYDFYLHMKDVHEKNGDKINKCNHCPFRTRWKSHLYLHIKNKHTDVEITYHNCKKCLFQTRWKSHLYKHIKDKHSIDRPVEYYNCENCDFQTKWQSHLYKHRKTKHPGVVYQRRHSRRSLVNHENIQKLFNKSVEEVQEDIEDMIEKFNDKINKRKRRNETSFNQTDSIENSKHIEMKNSNESGTFTSVWESFVYSCGNEQAENKGTKLDNEKGNNSNDEKGIDTRDEEIKYNLRKRDSKNTGGITKKEVASNKKQKQNNDKTPKKWNIDDSKSCVVEMNKDNACNVNLCKIQSLQVNKSRSDESKVKKRESKGKATIKKPSKVNEGSRKSKARKSEDEKEKNTQNEQVESYECSECSFKTQRMSKLKTHKLLAHAKK